MMDSTTDFTFDCVAGPDTLMSSVRLPAAGSACSEMTEKGWMLERVGAGAVPQAASANAASKMIAVLSILQLREAKNHFVTQSGVSQLRERSSSRANRGSPGMPAPPGRS